MPDPLPDPLWLTYCPTCAADPERSAFIAPYNFWVGAPPESPGFCPEHGTPLTLSRLRAE